MVAINTESQNYVPNCVHKNHNHDNEDGDDMNNDQTEFVMEESRRSSRLSMPRIEVPASSSNGGLAFGGGAQDELTRVIKSLLEKEEKQSTDDQIRKEWRQLAILVDRCLFWAFLVVTLTSTLMFIVVLPGINRLITDYAANQTTGTPSS